MQFGEIGIAETRIAQVSLEMASSITGRSNAQEKKKAFSLRSLGKSIAEEVSSSEEPLSIKFVPPAIVRATPTITWPAPKPIRYGDALSAAHLNASASVAGTFQYSPGLGSVLPAGTQTLTANSPLRTVSVLPGTSHRVAERVQGYAGDRVAQPRCDCLRNFARR